MENDDDNNQTNQNNNDHDEEMFTTIFEFLHTFHTISSEHYLENITDLTDGVVLFEALSEMYVFLYLIILFFRRRCSCFYI
jgi:hypothetical protein